MALMDIRPLSWNVEHKQISRPEVGVGMRGAIKCVAQGGLQVCGLVIRTVVLPLLIHHQQQQIDCQQMTGLLWQPPKAFPQLERRVCGGTVWIRNR